MDCIVHGILQARILEWVAFPFSRVSFQPVMEPRSPTLPADSLPAEPQEKPKNTGVGSLSLLQQIFPTQEWTRVSCIASGSFTNWAIREAPPLSIIKIKNTYWKHWARLLPAWRWRKAEEKPRKSGARTLNFCSFADIPSLNSLWYMIVSFFYYITKFQYTFTTTPW